MRFRILLQNKSYLQILYKLEFYFSFLDLTPQIKCQISIIPGLMVNEEIMTGPSKLGKTFKYILIRIHDFRCAFIHNVNQTTDHNEVQGNKTLVKYPNLKKSIDISTVSDLY